MAMKKLVVNKNYDGKKLSKYILENNEEITYSLFCKLLRKKDIKVNDRRITSDILIYKEDHIIIYTNDNLEKSNNNVFKVDEIYKDENILIINKPAGIEVLGENSLTEKLKNKYNDKNLMPCHRLDRNTKGLIIYAKNEESLKILTEKFKNHEIEKHYLALVYGTPKKNEENLEAYLFKDNKKSRVYISDKPKIGYKKILTNYKIIRTNNDNTTLLDVEIKTGRTHQIRAHLAHIGYPIIGDGKYGINEINKKFKKKYQELTSYIIKFKFKEDSKILNYLKDKEFKIS